MALELFLISHACIRHVRTEDDELSEEDRRRRDRRIPRLSVRKHCFSPFRHLCQSGVDQSLLNCCGVDHKTFRELSDIFTPVFDRHTIDKSTSKIRVRKLSKSGKPLGRNKDIDAEGCLVGLVLMWCRTRGSCAWSLVLGFGLTSTQLCKWLKFSRRVLLFVLQHHPAAKIRLPTGDEVQQCVDAICEQQPLLGPVWAAMGGLKLNLEKPISGPVQNVCCNGW